MFLRHFSASLGCVLLLLMASCDSLELIEKPAPAQAILKAGSPAFTQARRHLDVSLVSDSIDDIFVEMADRYNGFGGMYQNENGDVVLVSTQPQRTVLQQDELFSELLDRRNTNSRSRDILMRKEINVQPANYSFTELAVYRNVIERKLDRAIPVVLTDVDERNNVVLIGLDESVNIQENEVRTQIAHLGIPSDAVEIERMPVPVVAVGIPSSTLSLTDYVRPLAGGIKIDANGGCTLGLPVWYGIPGNQTRGFLTAAHCTSHVGITTNRTFGQPETHNAIGAEFEDPPLFDNCVSSSTLRCMIDAALVDLNNAHDNSINTLVSHVYRTNFSSSSGPGGSIITGEPVSLHAQSPFAGMDVNKVGIRTGWTTGDIIGTCVTIHVSGVRHPDGVKRTTWLPCAIKANTPVNSGDSGSSLFSILSDPEETDSGGFLGILSACQGCNPNVTSATGIGYYVSWATITNGLNTYFSLHEDQGGQ